MKLWSGIPGCRWPISVAYFLLALADFLSRTSSEAIPNLFKNPPTTAPRSLRNRDCIRSIQLLVNVNMVSTKRTQSVPPSHHKLIAHMRSLSPSLSTGKSQRQRINERNCGILTYNSAAPCSARTSPCLRPFSVPASLGRCMRNLPYSIERQGSKRLIKGATAVSMPP